MIPLEDALGADARVSWREAGHKGSLAYKKQALALRFTDLIHCATLVAVIGAAKGQQGLCILKYHSL